MISRHVGVCREPEDIVFGPQRGVMNSRYDEHCYYTFCYVILF